jgi:LysR family transcriptional regulator, regulator of abg operon
MKYRHVQAFIAVVEAGSFRAAARNLGISQPSLTKTLQDFEADLGTALVVRLRRGCVATPLGRVLFDRVKLVDEDLRRAREEIGQLLGAAHGEVRVALSPVASLTMGAEALTRFRRAYPEARVKICDGIFDRQLNSVRQGLVDFAIGGFLTDEVGPEFVRHHLFDNHIVPWVRLDHPLAGRARSLVDLQDYDWVLTNDDPRFISLIQRHFQRFGVRTPNVAVTCESFPMVLDIIPKTDLIAAFPARLSGNPLVSSRMSTVVINEPSPVTSLDLIKRADLPLTPLADHFAELFRRIARRLDDEAKSISARI